MCVLKESGRVAVVVVVVDEGVTVAIEALVVCEGGC